MFRRPRLTAAALICLALLPITARAEIERSGFPLIFHRIHGTAEDGMEIDRWNALLGLISSDTRTLPDGQQAGMWSVFPLLARSTDDLSGESVWSIGWPIPLMRFRTSDTGSAGYVFPALWYGDEAPQGQREGFALIPLLWRDRMAAQGAEVSTLWLFPFAGHRVELEDGTTPRRLWSVFPLYNSRTLLPPAEGDEPAMQSNWGLFPLMWGWRGDQFDHLDLFPLLFWRPARSLTVFPIYWQGEGYLSIFPLWGRYRAENHVQTTPGEAPDRITESYQYWLFPLLTRFQRQFNDEEPYRETLALWPLIAWGDGGGRHERRIFPLFRRATWERGEVRRESVQALFPLIWHSRVHRGETRAWASDVVFPLYWDFRWRRALVSEPGAAPEPGPENRMHVVFPFWIRHAVGGQNRTLWAPFPLLYALWAPPGETDGPVFGARFGLLLAGYQEWADGDTLFDILHILFRRGRDGSEVSTRTLGPLFATDRDPEEGTARVAVLWRLFEYEREGDDRGLRLLYLPWQIPLP